jgi:hypothetical protein
MALKLNNLTATTEENTSSSQASSSSEQTNPPQAESSQAPEVENGPAKTQREYVFDQPVSKRTGNGRFRHGVSGNPAGRPLGSRNRSTLALQEFLNEHGEIVLKKAVEMASEGNEKALQLVMERLVAPVKERVVPFSLPTPFSVHDLENATFRVVDDINNGSVSPPDAKIMLENLFSYIRCFSGR